MFFSRGSCLSDTRHFEAAKNIQLDNLKTIIISHHNDFDLVLMALYFIYVDMRTMTMSRSGSFFFFFR